MPQERDIKKLEGEIYIVELTLNDASGAVDCNNYDVYGAAETTGKARTSFDVTATDEPGKFHIAIPALSFTKYPYWDYQICARRRSTGHEWLILHGKISLLYRIADVPAVKVGAPQATFDATIAADSLSLTVNEIAGVKGDRGYSTYDIACQQGFEGTEEEWLSSLKAEYASEAVKAVAPYKTAAEQAAENASVSANDAAKAANEAHEYASEAEDCQSVAHEYMDTACEHMNAAAKSAAEAEQSAGAAAGSASHAAACEAEALGHAGKAEESAKQAQRSADDASAIEMSASEHMADAEDAAKKAEQAKTGAQTAQKAAEAAAGQAAQSAAEAETSATRLGDAALQSKDNSFTGNNDHAGTETFNGNVALNSGIAFPEGSTTVQELYAGYFYAKRYWELATDIAQLFQSQNIDFLPKDENGLVKLKFTNATQGQYAFRHCKCYSGLNLELPAITNSSNLLNILVNFSSVTNTPYNYATIKLDLPKITAVNFVGQIWAERYVVNAPLSVSFSCSARGMAVYGSMPKTETVSCVHEYYTKNPEGGHKWFVALPALKKGSFGAGTSGYNFWRLSADSVFCILGTIPVWTDGAAHTLHLNILPALKNDAEFQARLLAALGTQNENGTYQGALVRVYEEGGSSGSDELGAYTDSYVESKGWTITVTYN